MSTALEQLHDELNRHQVENHYEPGDLIKILDYIDRLRGEVDEMNYRILSLESARANAWRPENP